MESTRPFFSLVIPCYNDGRYKAGTYLDRLLTSVVESNLDKDDIEIILADDHSPKSYDRIVNKFSKYFNIKRILTAYNFAPGNTRQCGVMVATGQWLCFADHDDTFYPRALHTVKDLIQSCDRDVIYVHSDFDKVASDDLGKIVETFYGDDNNNFAFVHGKFYNLDRFWHPYKLRFPTDLRTHEDVALGNQVRCALRHVDESQVLRIPTPVYRWTDNEVSISNTRYGEEDGFSFFERHYQDYIRAGLEQYINRFELGQLELMEFSSIFITYFLTTWFDLNKFRMAHPDTYLKENVIYIHKVWKHFKKVTKFSTSVIKVMMAKISPDTVASINRTAAYYHIGNLDAYIELLDREDRSE